MGGCPGVHGEDGRGHSDRLGGWAGLPELRGRGAVAFELLRLTDEQVKARALAELKVGLDDPNRWICEAAGLALLEHAGEQVLAGLAARLNDIDLGRKWAHASERMSGTGEQVVGEVVALLESPDLNDIDFGFKWAYALERMLGTREQATIGLVTLLDAPDPRVRWMAALALAERDEVHYMVGALTRLSHLESRVRLAYAQVRFGSVGRLNSYPNSRSRWTTPHAVGCCADAPQVMAKLVARLDDPDPGVRQAAALALVGATDAQVTVGLIGLLEDPNADVRRAVAWALSVVEDPHEARKRCASLLGRWAQASPEVREHLYVVLAALAPMAYCAERPAERPAWRAAIAEITRTALAEWATSRSR